MDVGEPVERSGTSRRHRAGDDRPLPLCHSVLVPLMTSPGFRFEEFAARHPDSPLDQLRRDLVAFFVEERRARRIGPNDPGAAALMIVALAQSIAFFEHMGAHDGHFPPELLGRAVRCLWDGLAPLHAH